MSKKSIIDEHGNLFVHLGEGDEIRRKKQKDTFKMVADKKEQYKNELELYGEFFFAKRDKPFTRKNMVVNNEIDYPSLARLFYMLTYMSYDKVLLTDKGAHINKKILFDIMKFHRDTFNKWFAMMESSGIIQEVEFDDGSKTSAKKSYLVISSDCYVKGEIKGTKDSYMKMFLNTIREIYESNIGKNMTTIGMVYTIIPYINTEFNTLCHNVNCKDKNDLNLITAGELANLFGYEGNIGRMEKMLSKIKLSNGEPMLLFITDGDRVNDKVLVNDLIMYSGNDRDSIRGFFKSYATKPSNDNRSK